MWRSPLTRPRFARSTPASAGAGSLPARRGEVSRGDAMTVKRDTVRAMNDAYAGLSLKPARIEELPIELQQLRSAIEAVRAKVDFDVDPFDFQVALKETARSRK